ncbi:hypothetical protein [Sandarakinorhabdus sp. DWP1-3-1]|uniref:hypothetical protein n=1 Tax=Sandarakinorhabdus sp. DWP1-3-1 TaxID=2804627 RepID=UPI003CE955CC
MPSKKMAVQTGNSCAAHCHVIAVAEMFDTTSKMTPWYAEKVVWPAIRFEVGENQGHTDGLAALENTDPRKLERFANTVGGGEAITATLKCDDTAKAAALKHHVTGVAVQKLDLLFNLIKGQNATVTTAIDEGSYYNCTFLMFNGPAPTPAVFGGGMHNILVTRSGGNIWHYNSNEAHPAWVRTAGNDAWKVLPNQNGGIHSYVFTGVMVAMQSKV